MKMNTTQIFLQSIFPLPQSLQQLIQAQSFLILSTLKQIKPSSHIITQPHTLTKSKPVIIKCLQYPTSQQARQNDIKFSSLSNAFYLQIYKITIKQLVQKNTWCLIVQMQQPLMSIKQKLNKTSNNNKGQNKSLLNQDELIMTINCMNILYDRHIKRSSSIGRTTRQGDNYFKQESNKLSINQLLDNIFVTEQQQDKRRLIKLSLPQLSYYNSILREVSKDYPNNSSNKSSNNSSFITTKKKDANSNNNNKRDVAKYALFMIQTILATTMMKRQSHINNQDIQTLMMRDIMVLKDLITNRFKVDKYCMKQLKEYLLNKIDDAIYVSNGDNINKKDIKDNVMTVDENRLFSSRVNQNKHQFINTYNKERSFHYQYKQRQQQQQQSLTILKQNFPTIKFTKRPKNINHSINVKEYQKHKHIEKQNKQKQTIKQQQSLLSPSSIQLLSNSTYQNNNNNNLSIKYITLNDLSIKYITLNDLANEKIVQSFQQDEYSYILSSNIHTSPSRMSPFHLNKNIPNKGSRVGLSNNVPLMFSRQQQHQQRQQQPLNNNKYGHYQQESYQHSQQQQKQLYKFKQTPSPIKRNKFLSSPSPQSFITSQSHVIPQQVSNSYDLQQQPKLKQHLQQQQQPLQYNQQLIQQQHKLKEQQHKLKEQQQEKLKEQQQEFKEQQEKQQPNTMTNNIGRSRSNSHTSNLQHDANSIIIEVEDEQIQNNFNHDNQYIEGQSSYFNSQLVQLSYSRGGVDQQLQEKERKQIDGMEKFQSLKNQINMRQQGDNKDTIKQEDYMVNEIFDQQQGTIYYGQVKNNIKQGKGKIIYHDQGFFEGQWKNNTITGFGRLFYPSKKLAYAGYWHQGCFHGPGLVLNQTIEPITEQNPFDFTDLSNLGRTWISYRGNFNMDVRQGYGVVKLSNGDSIAGVWSDNCLNGQAEYSKKDGSKMRAVWKMNKLLKIISKTQNNP